MEITDQSFNIVDIKPANMEELTEVNSEHVKSPLSHMTAQELMLPFPILKH